MASGSVVVETFDHAYFVFIDAAGHSSIVQNNPRDRAEQGFDLLRAVVDRRLATVASEAGCHLARVWQWAGDGGLLIVNDDRESVAVGAALRVARTLLDLDLPQLRQRFAELPLRGELRLRVSVHKGTMRYRGPGSESAIYGTAVNLAAHLERAAPPDTVAISADVHRVAGEHAEHFWPVGPFEDTDVYLWQVGGGDPVRSWLGRHGLAGGVPVHAYPERPSQAEKARLVDAAMTEVLDVGISLNTCANYLVTRERPARHRQAVLEFLGRGGRYRCVLTDPDSAAAAAIGEQRGEDVPGEDPGLTGQVPAVQERTAPGTGSARGLRQPDVPGPGRIRGGPRRPAGAAALLALPDPVRTRPAAPGAGRHAALSRVAGQWSAVHGGGRAGPARPAVSHPAPLAAAAARPPAARGRPSR
jgi:class 3 adenylate cyclase